MWDNGLLWQLKQIVFVEHTCDGDDDVGFWLQKVKWRVLAFQNNCVKLAVSGEYGLWLHLDGYVWWICTKSGTE